VTTNYKWTLGKHWAGSCFFHFNFYDQKSEDGKQITGSKLKRLMQKCFVVLIGTCLALWTKQN